MEQVAEPGEILRIERAIDPEKFAEFGEPLRAGLSLGAEDHVDHIARDEPQHHEDRDGDTKKHEYHLEQAPREVSDHG